MNETGEGTFCEVVLGCRSPFDFERILSFFRYRELAGVESVDDVSYARTVRLENAAGGELVGWMRVSEAQGEPGVVLRVGESLSPAIDEVAKRVRRMFDLDCDPEIVHAALAPLEAAKPGCNVLGTRVPGAFDSFEIAVRAILGQQVSVVAANKIAARIASEYGRPVDTGVPGLELLFPTARDFLAMDPIEDALGRLGVIKTRSRTIRSLAELVESGELSLDPAADVAVEMGRLIAVKGIGEWSQNYIAMRTLGYRDAFLEKDAGVKHALPGLEPKERSALVEPCRPWRAYANLCLWNSLSS